MKNTQNMETLSKELEAAQLHLNKLAGQIVEAAAELESLWMRIDLATVQLADPDELRETTRRFLAGPATDEDRARLLAAYGIDLPAGASRKDALFAIRDKLEDENTESQTGENSDDEIIISMCDTIHALRAENEELRAELAELRQQGEQ